MRDEEREERTQPGETMYAGWAYLAETGASRHEVLRLILRTVDDAIAVKES